MFINLKDNKLVITFPYSPKTVKAVKSITGRTWNVLLRRWEIPRESVSETLRILTPLGFTAHVDVKKISEEENNIISKAAEIKNLPDDSPDIPYNGSLPLFNFQRKGAAFIRSLPACILGDSMGLGKSIQTIAALEGTPGPHLVLTMASLKYNFEEEIQKWTKHSTVVIDGDKRSRQTKWFYAPQKDFTIANYELLLHDFEEISKVCWASITCDEATRISNAEAKTTIALKRLSTRKKIALTGTPISNSPVDIYSIIDWIAPHYLGTLWQFKDRYCVMNDMGMLVGYQNLDELKEKVARFMLRRTKQEVLTDLPAKTVENIIFSLSEDESILYDKVRRLLIEELEMLHIDRTTLPLIPVKMLRLKQFTDHPSLISEDGFSTKLFVLEGILERAIADGQKVIVFTQFKKMLDILMPKFKKYNPVPIHGDLPPATRQDYVKRFTEIPEHKMIIMTEAGAYGLNLQAGSVVVHYDLPWSVSKMNQREDRAHRYGQKRAVTVYSLIAKDTIDEYVAKVLHKKSIISNDILDDESRLDAAGLTEEDIKAILRI